jgi:hypothetical protein
LEAEDTNGMDGLIDRLKRDQEGDNCMMKNEAPG